MDDVVTQNSLAKQFSVLDKSPSKIFTAAAGAAYGQVEARKQSANLYIIRYVDWFQTYYAYSTHNDYLTDWLEPLYLHHGSSMEDFLVHYANLYGIQTIPLADETTKGPFYVIATRKSDGGIETSFLVRRKRFKTYKKASSWIAIKGNNFTLYTIIST